MNEIQNAIIDDAIIKIDDHNILTVWLYFSYGHGGQGFGGYALYLPESFNHHSIKSGYAGHFIYRCMKIAGVSDWSEMKGRTLRVDARSDRVDGIGHIINDDWFYPNKDFAKKAEMEGND